MTNFKKIEQYYENYEQFDVVLLFGPLYHLLDKTERTMCIKEVYRVLKKDGLVSHIEKQQKQFQKIQIVQ